MPLRIIFMGTPEFSVPTLEAIAAAGHEVVAVYTQPPRPAGRRGLELKKSAVHETAERLGLPVRTPKSLKSEAEQAAFRDLGADAAVVVAYGLILPKPILDGTRLGAFNGHASLLPRWRGAAPIQRAIMAGDEKTGMMIMKMDEGLDTGPIALTQEIAIGAEMTAAELHDRLKLVGAELLVRALGDLERGNLLLTPQADEDVTYASKISKEETRVDWNRPARAVHDHIRGLSPFPGAWCEMPVAGKSERVKLLRSTMAEGNGPVGQVMDDELAVACAEGAIRITELQRAGSRAMTAADFLLGAKIPRGTRLQ